MAAMDQISSNLRDGTDMSIDNPDAKSSDVWNVIKHQYFNHVWDPPDPLVGLVGP